MLVSLGAFSTGTSWHLARMARVPLTPAEALGLFRAGTKEPRCSGWQLPAAHRERSSAQGLGATEVRATEVRVWFYTSEAADKHGGAGYDF